MKATKYYCDICGEERSRYDMVRIKTRAELFTDYNPERDRIKKGKMDICYICAREFKEYVRRRNELLRNIDYKKGYEE